MSNHSFLLKGWGVTLVAALFALAAKDANTKYILIAFLPVLIFWAMDAYFLSQERSYRALYEKVRKQTEADVDFSMNVREHCNGKNGWWSCFYSTTIVTFYLSLLGVMLITMCLIN
jgi:hypothetical protein